VRVVCFGNVQQKVDHYLATNIPEHVMSNEEIGEAYRQCWVIEVLWKFPEVLNSATKVHKLEADKVFSEKFFRYSHFRQVCNTRLYL